VARADVNRSGTAQSESNGPPRFRRAGIVARWKPVHLGHAAALRALCDVAGEALIGIGSSNRYDVRNPFTARETADMIRLVLGRRPGWRLIEVPDLDDGPRWRGLILDLFGSLDVFVTDNAYVASLLRGDYSIVRPVELVPLEARVRVDGTMVRGAMARGGDWRTLVPAEVAGYIDGNGLEERLQREFGAETLAAER